jgi:hypothetical protein
LIREALLADLPKAFDPPRRPDLPKVARRRWIKILAILAAVYLLAGWTIGPSHWIGWLICAGLITDIVRRLNASDGRRGLTAAHFLLTFLVAAVGTAILLYWFFDAGRLIGYVPLIVGYFIADQVDSGAIADQSSKACGALLRAIAQPVICESEAERKGIWFKPHWPFRSEADETIWAIDPSNRAIRLMLPALRDVDVVLVWDEPIRAVELRRIRQSRWAAMWRGASAVPDSRELEVLSGRDQASAWGFVFHFYGLDKEAAEHWRKTFEQWMREDKRSEAA